MTPDQFWFMVRATLWAVGVLALIGSLLEWPTEDTDKEDDDDEG